MENKNFIGLTCLKHNVLKDYSCMHNGKRVRAIEKCSVQYTSTNIRLDSILRVDAPEEKVIYDDGEFVETICIAKIYTSCIVGLGINGIDTCLWITKESYNAIVEALKLR